MKHLLFVRLTIYLFILIPATFFSSSALSQKVSFNTSTVVPSAEGTVKVKKDNNGNYGIEIYIENLAEPKKLTPSKKAYVVWVESQEKGVKNMGQIHTSSSLFSKTKKASMTTVSPYKPTRVYVSAEDKIDLDKPGTVVLTTNSF